MPPGWDPVDETFSIAGSTEVAVVSHAPGSLHVIVNDIGPNGHVYVRKLTGDAWAGNWKDLGNPGTVLSPGYGPAAVVTPDGHIDAYVVGAEGTISWSRWDPVKEFWPGLRNLEKPISAPVELISAGSWGGETAIFMRGGNNEPYYMPHAIPTYTWRRLGEELLYGPVVVTRPGERMDVFGVGTGFQLSHKWCTSGLRWHPAWDKWDPLGGNFNQRPAVVRLTSADLHLFGAGHDERGYQVIHHWELNGDQWTKESLSWPGITNLRAVSWGPDRIDLFARNASNSVVHRAWNAGQWSPPINEDWENLGGEFYVGRPPAAVSWGPNRVDVFIIADPEQDGNGNVWHRWWDGAQWMPLAT